MATSIQKIRIPAIGMYSFLKPVLEAWAVHHGYRFPEEEEVAENLVAFYREEFPQDSELGKVYGEYNYNGAFHQILIRLNIKIELEVWAHEFAHMIQAINEGAKNFKEVYGTEREANGYYDSRYEVEARTAMELAKDLGDILPWKSAFNKPGEGAVCIKSKREL
jgi:hypothetical protein